MAGNGPPPKPNAVDRKRGVKIVHDLTPGEPWPVPDGVWHPKAVRWWERMTSSPTAKLWDSPADVDQLERGLAHAHKFWTLFDDDRPVIEAEAILMRVETVLWLNRAERARQGIRADLGGQAKPEPSFSPSRERLRALDGRADAVG